MTRNKKEFRSEIEEGIQDHEYRKTSRKKNSLSKEEFLKCNVELTPKQNLLYKGIRNNILTVVHGPAGTSKTFTTCYTALALLADKKIEKIIITKPIQESGENLGFLPGDLKEKLHPYRQSYYNSFCKIIGRQNTDFLFSTEDIVFEPLAYMRGSTYDNSIMLLDECFTGDTKINTSLKGNYIRIKDIVKKFKKGQNIYLPSWNDETHQIEEKMVTGVFENGEKEIFEIYISGRIKKIKTTENHPFATFKDGEIIWKEVNDLSCNDSIIRFKKEKSNNSTILTNESYDIILGMILGDSSILKNKQKKESYRIHTNHSISQKRYMSFKKDIFSDISSYRNGLKSGYTGNEQCGFSTKTLDISTEFISSILKDGKKSITSEIHRWFSNRTLAIWYMDDGNYNKNNKTCTFSTHSFDISEVEILKEILKDKFDIESTSYKTNKGIVLSINRVNSEKMFSIISKYIHPSMYYKMDFVREDFDNNLYKIKYDRNLTLGDIERIVKTNKKEEVFNIEVDGNNNYFTENILVHNCQNASIKQLMLWVTRLGKDSKAVMMGDTSQYDVRKRDSGYNDFIKMVDGMTDLNLFEFENEDIVRNKFLIEIANRYDKYRSQHE